MGGHGGLNILPQKSWNVYGQTNRDKVAADEAAKVFGEETRDSEPDATVSNLPPTNLP